jgi:coproporphyrinogen III oxidase
MSIQNTVMGCGKNEQAKPRKTYFQIAKSYLCQMIENEDGKAKFFEEKWQLIKVAVVYQRDYF